MSAERDIQEINERNEETQRLAQLLGVALGGLCTVLAIIGAVIALATR